MIEPALLIVVGLVTWLVAAEGIWGAAQTFICTLLGGLLAMNYFEPLAMMLKPIMPDDYCDIVALLGLFTAFVFALRMGAEQLSPSYIQVFPALDTAGRYVFGAATGYLTMAILLTSLHTAPLPREFMGFKPEKNNFFTLAPDRQWLGFTQYVSEKPLMTPYRAKVENKDLIIAGAFDGRFEVVGDPSNVYKTKDLSGKDVPQIIWPSFPIRYAMRRERIAAGQPAGAAVAPAAAPAAPPPNLGGQGGPVNPGF